MKIARYQHDNEIFYGSILDDGTIEQLDGSPFDGEVRPTGQHVRRAEVVR